MECLPGKQSLLYFSDGVPDDRLPFLRRYLSGVAQIDFVMEALIGDVQRIPLLFHELMHQLYRRGFVVIGTDVHALYAQALFIGEKLGLGEVRLFFLPASATAQSKSALVTKSGRRMTEIHWKLSFRA